jgi:hypothetical protein
MGRPEWALAFEDEVWWSRLAHPALHAWAEPDRPLRLVAQAVAKEDPDPKALACYGLLLRWWDRGPDAPPRETVWLRFVDGRPVSAVTTRFLAWSCARLAALGKTALLLVWDNAAWHLSKEVRAWVRQHNCRVRETGTGVRLVQLVARRDPRRKIAAPRLLPPLAAVRHTNAGVEVPADQQDAPACGKHRPLHGIKIVCCIHDHTDALGHRVAAVLGHLRVAKIGGDDAETRAIGDLPERRRGDQQGGDQREASSHCTSVRVNCVEAFSSARRRVE